MNDEALRQTIDACRPENPTRSSNDLAEFAEVADLVATDRRVRRLYEASQEFDAALGTAVHDVPVPPGLAERLLASALQSEAPQPVETDEPISEPTTVALPAPRRARGWVEAVEWSSPLAVVVLVAVALGVVQLSSPRPITTDQLLERSVEWRDQIDHEQWNENLKVAPRDDFPPSPQMAFAPWRWQRIENPHAKMVVYYGGPPGAMLFVVRSKSPVQGLSTTPKVLSTTGGWTVGAWQSGELTYVFVVEGDRRRYESHFKPSSAA